MSDDWQCPYHHAMFGERLFQVGDGVAAKSFTDCFGEYHPAIEGLVVSRIQTIENSCPHHRVLAIDPTDPYKWVEGAESYFERE